MGKNNNQRIKELQQSLAIIESECNKLKQQIDDNKNYLDSISQHSENADKNYTKIKEINQQADSAITNITKTAEAIAEIKEELNQKLNATEVKKEDIDKFFIKVFGEKDEQGNYSGGLKERLNQKEAELNNFLKVQNEKHKDLFNKIEKLLPAATTTGLAIAFSNQKKSYKTPSIIWAFIFILSLLGFLFIGVFSFEEGSFFKSFHLPDWKELLARTPIFLPAI